METAPQISHDLSLSTVISALRERVAAWGGRGLLPSVLVVMLYRRLGEIGRRIGLMLVRLQAGQTVRRGMAGGRGDGAAAGAAASARVIGCGIWPTQFGWLVRAALHEAAGLGGQLRLVLQQPEMVALLAAAPQAQRVLRPLCRALAIEPSLLWPEGAVEREVVPVAAASRVRTPRVRTKRRPLDLGRIALPRGVLSAVRRQGFGKFR